MAKEKETPEPAEEAGGGGKGKKKVKAEENEKVEEGQLVTETNKDARMWAMFCHLAGLAGIIIPAVGNIVGPLVIWQIKKDDFPFVDEQGKEAVNFQITMSICGLICIPLFFVCVGPFLLSAVGIVDLVFLLIAGVKANNGYSYRYPLAIRFIK